MARQDRVSQKLSLPDLPVDVIARPRLDRLYAGLLQEHKTLAVFASAGSGKTVEAQLFAQRQGWPLAWVTLDGGDCSPTTMLATLAAATEPAVDDVEAMLDGVLTSASLVEDLAAVLAEAVVAPRLMLVVDRCEAVVDAPDSCAVLDTFVASLPDGVRTLLLSRSEMPVSLGRSLLGGRLGRITDEDLALTLEEADELVRARRADPGVVDAQWRQSRGWVAAVVLGGAGGDESEALTSFLLSEVLDVLPPRERRFLLETSILDTVSLREATLLCGDGCRTLWRDVGLRHLPSTTSADRALVYHPSFRAFLRSRFALEEPERMRTLQRRYASLLLETHEYEAATDLLIALDELDEAAGAADKACEALVERGAWGTLLRWTEALGHDRVHRFPRLLAGLLRSLRGRRRAEEVRTLVRELEGTGRLAEVVVADPGVSVQAAWSMMWEPAEALALLDKYGDDPRVASARYLLDVTSSDVPAGPPRGLPWAETDRLVSWALLVQGRIHDLVAMLPDSGEWPPSDHHTTPYPLLGLVWRGETTEVRARLDEVPAELKRRSQRDVWYYIHAWLLLIEGDGDAALAAAELAVAHSRRTCFGFEPVYETLRAQALLDVGRVDEAVALLVPLLEPLEQGGLVAYVEWVRTFLGRALLMQGDAEAAATALRATVQGMARARRLLLLPFAAVYLAEAEARLGDTAAADAAAQLAYDVAAKMGALPVLARALDHFPAVLRRQLDRDEEAGWRRMGASSNGGAGSALSPRGSPVVAVDIQPFGASPDISIGGQPAGVRRLKVLELACFLAARPEGATRKSIQAHLFPESDHRRSGNHFRQVIHQFGKTTNLKLERGQNARVSWPAGLHVDAADLHFERALAEARMLDGDERLARLQGALSLVSGPYLAASDLEWVSVRRFELDVLEEDAELEAARLGLELREFDVSRACAESLLARNPYLEAAYQVLIEVELAIGTETAALGAYRRAVASLRDIGLEPGAMLAQLLHRQRV